MENIKICMITTRHLPGDARIFEKEARSLKKMGFDVDIVVPEGKLPPETDSIRFLLFQKARGPFRKLSTIIQTYKKSKTSGAHIYHCHEPDVSLFIGYILKITNREKGIKLIFDCHEFFLKYFAERLPRPFRLIFKGLFLAYEKFIIRHCDYIITANTIERSYYQILFPLKKTAVIYNVPHSFSAADIHNLKDKNGPNKLYDLCYEGFLNFERGARILFEVVKQLKEERGNIKLLIIGEFNEDACARWAESFIKDNRLEGNIIFAGWQPYQSLHKFHSQSKIGIYLYQYVSVNLLSGPPNKLFNFMKAGLPIIASRLPETLNIMNEIKCGIAVDPYNSGEITSAVIQLLDDPSLREEMGIRGRKAFSEKYNWEFAERELLEIYQEILPPEFKDDFIRRYSDNSPKSDNYTWKNTSK